jgi:hypothetical protein
MTEGELKHLYRTACAGKNYEPTDGQFKIWKQTLGWCEEVDLSQALVWYFQDNTGFPMPAELKTLSETARRQRVSRIAVVKDEVRWRCPDCGVTMTGFIDPTDRAIRVCRGFPAHDRPQTNPDGSPIPCGGIMDEIARMTCAAQAKGAK